MGEQPVQAFHLSARSAEIMLHVIHGGLCASAVAEKTTGAMGNIVAATGLVKKDEFPTDMNVRTPLQSPSVFLLGVIRPDYHTVLEHTCKINH